MSANFNVTDFKLWGICLVTSAGLGLVWCWFCRFSTFSIFLAPVSHLLSAGFHLLSACFALFGAGFAVFGERDKD